MKVRIRVRNEGCTNHPYWYIFLLGNIS